MIKWSDNEEFQMEYEEEVKDYPEKKRREQEKNKEKHIQICMKLWKKEKSMRKTKKERDRESYLKRKEEIKNITFIRKKHRWERREKWAAILKNCMFLNKPFEGCEKHHVNKNTIACVPKELHRAVSHNLKTGKGMVKINDLVFEWLELHP